MDRKWPLEKWHEAFAKKSDGELTVEDLAVALRQRIETDRVLPLALSHFEQDPMAGEKYESELFFALLGVSLSKLQEYPESAEQMKTMAQQFAASDDINERLVVLNWLERWEIRDRR